MWAWPQRGLGAVDNNEIGLRPAQTHHYRFVPVDVTRGWQGRGRGHSVTWASSKMTRWDLIRSWVLLENGAEVGVNALWSG